MPHLADPQIFPSEISTFIFFSYVAALPILQEKCFCLFLYIYFDDYPSNIYICRVIYY